MTWTMIGIFFAGAVGIGTVLSLFVRSDLQTVRTDVNQKLELLIKSNDELKAKITDERKDIEKDLDDFVGIVDREVKRLVEKFAKHAHEKSLPGTSLIPCPRDQPCPEGFTPAPRPE